MDEEIFEKIEENEIGLPRRPISIIVIVILMAFFVLVSVYRILSEWNDPEKIEYLSKNFFSVLIQRSMAILHFSIYTICAFNFLKGRNWSRFLFSGWFVLMFGFAYTNHHEPRYLIPGVLFSVISIIFLFRKDANLYFLGRKTI